MVNTRNGPCSGVGQSSPRERERGHQQALLWEERLAHSPWLRVSSGARLNLIKKGIAKSSSDSGCEIILSNPNNFYGNQLPCQKELQSKVGA